MFTRWFLHLAKLRDGVVFVLFVRREPTHTASYIGSTTSLHVSSKVMTSKNQFEIDDYLFL
jgi:hypothetical protein